MQKRSFLVSVFLVAVVGARAAPVRAEATPEAAAIERGRYLVTIGACNDCHTPGYAQSGGATPEGAWLTGNGIGFQGAWGTTYPANLRLVTQRLSEDQWVARARSAMRPPMPWFVLNSMKEDDVRAVYRFIRHLGAEGKPAPSYVAPGEVPATPVIHFEPVVPPVPGQPLVVNDAG
ncbi:MAG: cytochrome C [Gammaproteobacteria bacterium]|nr:cytochrome C [Gammaproteobacteria bacterium]